MTSALTIECRACHGAGRVHLPPEYSDVLRWLSSWGEATADLMYERKLRKYGVGRTTANNRLEFLRRLGLVVRVRRDGRNWVYAATPSPQAPGASDE